jgi:hypothetical protein
MNHRPSQELGPLWTFVLGAAAQTMASHRSDQEGEESLGTSFWCSPDGGRRRWLLPWHRELGREWETGSW